MLFKNFCIECKFKFHVTMENILMSLQGVWGGGSCIWQFPGYVFFNISGFLLEDPSKIFFLIVRLF